MLKEWGHAASQVIQMLTGRSHMDLDQIIKKEKYVPPFLFHANQKHGKRPCPENIIAVSLYGGQLCNCW